MLAGQSGPLALAAAVLRQAVLDAQSAASPRQREARVWFAQREHHFWLGVLGVAADTFDRRLAGLEPDPADLAPAPAPPPLPPDPPAVALLKELKGRAGGLQQRTRPAPATAPPPPPPVVRPVPPDPHSLAARFPLGCTVRLNAHGQEQLGRYDARHRRRATVVGYSGGGTLLKIAREGLKTVVTYGPAFWERED